MNYTTLQEQVANHFVSVELVQFVPTAIEMAEAEFDRRLRVREMVARSFTLLDPTAAKPQFVALPADFNAVRSLYITGTEGYRLEFLPMDHLRLEKAQRPETGDPCVFTVIGGEFELVPVPSAARELEIVYYQKIPKLSDMNLTNWLIDSNPDMYLYGTLLQVSPYLDKDRRIPTWQQFYETALSELALQSQRAEFSGGPLKMQAAAL